MGSCCSKKRTSSHTELRSDFKQLAHEDTIRSVKEEDLEESSLLDSTSPSTLQDIPPQQKNPETQPTTNDASLHSTEETNQYQEGSPPRENGIIDEQRTEKRKDDGLILSHPVPMTGDRLLINELKTKFPEGLEDLKRRTRETLQNSFRRSQQKGVLLPPPTQVCDALQKHPNENLVDNLKTLEEKLRNTQKLIINNTELSMTNTLEQFKLDLANTETSLHPVVIDKRREVYCKLKVCYSLSSKQEKPKTLECHEDGSKDSKKSTDLLKLEGWNQRLNYLTCYVEETKDVPETQNEIEDIVVSLENIKAARQEELIFKNYLKEKSLYLIKECILKNMR